MLLGTKAGVPCGKIEGADPPTLAKRVQELANEPAPSESKQEGVDGVHPELQAKLKKLIRCDEDQRSVQDGSVVKSMSRLYLVETEGDKRAQPHIHPGTDPLTVQ